MSEPNAGGFILGTPAPPGPLPPAPEPPGMPSFAADASPSAPIADLSYRNYDGPLQARTFRFWIIALANLRASIRKPLFWVLAALSGGGAFLTLILLFLRSQMPAQLAEATRQPWAEFFAGGTLAWSLFFLFVLTLTIGAGSIAADSRANALLVYLSKPIGKLDYLVGKWIGVFIPLFGVALVPSLLVYVYGILALTSEGFFSSDPWLLARITAVAALTAAMHTSLMIGFSSCTKSSRMAGALYAGLYFLGSIVALIASLIHMYGGHELRRSEVSPTSITIFFASVPGMIEGVAQHIYRLSHPQTVFGPNAPNPRLLPLAIGLGVAIVAPPLVAWLRLRAVEIVRG